MLKIFYLISYLIQNLVKFCFFRFQIEFVFSWTTEEVLRLFASLQDFLMCIPLSCDAIRLAWASRDEVQKHSRLCGFFLLFYSLKEFDELLFPVENMLKVLKVLVQI